MTDFTASLSPELELSRPIRLGAWSLAAFGAILIAWSIFTTISGAVMATGQTIVQGRPQLVQSLTGGTVSELLVQDGMQVRQGQLLARLDATLVTAALDIAQTRLADALALQARLEAEEQGRDAPDFAPPTLPVPTPDFRNQAEGQRRIFEARAAVLAGQRDRLTESEAQINAQIEGIKAQMATQTEQLALLAPEITTQQSLLDQGLSRASQLTDLRRAEATARGELGSLTAEATRLRTSLRDRALETLQDERNFQEKVVTDLRDTRVQIEELTLEILSRSAELDKLQIRSPAEGIVHEMQVTTLGGIVPPGGTLLEVIPLDRGVEFDLQVDPRGIDQVHLGQKAEVVLSSFDPRVVPRLNGEVVSRSPDAVQDPRSGRSFYRVKLTVPPAELARLNGEKLLPGMPVEAYLATSDRSVLAYLLQPLTKQIVRAFRED